MNDNYRIAVIGWGSLIWEQRDLETDGSWHEHGPTVDLEFSRVSNDDRLTLVIDEQYGVPCRSLYAVSVIKSLKGAIENLRAREGTIQKRNGFIDFRVGNSCPHAKESHPSNLISIREWGEKKHVDAVIWTVLSSSFENKKKQEFSIQNAIDHLNELSGDKKNNAIKYYKKAPPTVITPLRTELSKIGFI